ncbi:hypothetical protein FIBSPDRAFT_885906 [Athelia psychrophila]|uniref:Uncharacterized protein n=1 Tax=Athelia psychrophila TaxID=1759441 RepID=A0A166RJM8_9AGAM|nr:hypothetical protein FIBSPDRAFT_885906 [Fibularhizoctonia sp. CBS 109695]
MCKFSSRDVMCVEEKSMGKISRTINHPKTSLMSNVSTISCHVLPSCLKILRESRSSTMEALNDPLTNENSTLLTTSHQSPTPPTTSYQSTILPTTSTPDRPYPLRTYISLYRLLNIVLLLGLGIPKAVMSAKGLPGIAGKLDWAGGLLIAVMLYLLGLYESEKDLPWTEWFFRMDVSRPAVDFWKSISRLAVDFLKGISRPAVDFWKDSLFRIYLATLVVVPGSGDHGIGSGDHGICGVYYAQ